MTRWLDKKLYPHHEDGWDNQLFRNEILKCLRGHEQILDMGAGAGIIPEMNFRADAARICGIDLDERVLSNPNLHEARLGTAESIPYPDETFDLVICK